MMHRLWLAGLLVTAAIVGCQSGSPTQPEKVYDLKGTVVSIEKDKLRIIIDHEEIPGLMKAMKMPFGVADPQILEQVKPGDAVEGRLKVDAGKYVIMELKPRP